MSRILALLLACLPLYSPAWGQPLTLQQALRQAAGTHPDMQLARALERKAEAAERRLQTPFATSLYLELDARWIDVPRDSFYRSPDDSRASLILEKTLYQFGRRKWLRRAGAAWRLEAREQARDLLQDLEQEVTAAFFDVLLADLAFNTANEAMSIAYIRYDRANERLELEQVSELETARLYAAYQETRLQVRRAEQAQRLTRERLALLLGRPDDPPAELLEPVLMLERPVPEFETLKARIDQHPALRSLQQQSRALRAEAEALRLSLRPSLRLEAGYTEYSQPFSTRSPARASLVLRWPFTDGQQARQQAVELEAQAEAVAARADRLALELRQNLLATLQAIRAGQVELERNLAERDYRELDLDKRRALYEMEVKADLGDAMVAQSQVQWQTAQSRYRLGLRWLELARLTHDPQWKPWKEEP